LSYGGQAGGKNMTLRNKWTPEQIRTARQIPLRPLLEKMGYAMQQKPSGNWSVNTLPGDIVIKDNYWVSLTHGRGGNTIDLFTHVMGMKFTDAMKTIEEFMQP